ncbi:MAG: NF038122 family metalloprotease [Cyanobacteria bacterium J06635_15]
MVQFNFTYDPGVSLEQRIGFELAAAIWSTFLTDDVTINLQISAVTNLGDGQAVGGAIPIFHGQNYGVFQAYVAQDGTSEEDNQANQILQDGNTVDVVVDGELIDGNTEIMLTSAQAKALGMTDAFVLEDGSTWDRNLIAPNALDGYILINNSYDWSYDFTRESDALAGTLDFLTMALHEIGHALGFVSGLDGLLDVLELHSGETRAEGFTALDMFRHTLESQAVDNPDGTVADLTLGANAHFSLDGETAIATFSTGQDTTAGGDGYQASHWERFQQAVGIMDPTLGYQERTDISHLDLQAFDALGWDIDYAALEQGLDFQALYSQALAEVAADFGIGVAGVETALANGQDWYTLGHGSWWEAFKDQMLAMGYSSWWQQFEADLLEMGYSSWWQAFDQQMLEMGYSSWWQAFEDQVLQMGYSSWWQQFESELLEMGYSSWWQQFEPKMLEMSYGSWWQIFEQQMLAMGYSSWWQQFESELLEMGYSSWWQAFEARVLEMGYSSWWQIFEEQVLEMGYSSWWQEFETNILEMGYSSWWQLFEMGYSSWWQQLEQHIDKIESWEDDIPVPNPGDTPIVMTGGAADDILVGGQGQDLVSGSAGDDLIDGKEGNDLLLGDEGNDIVYGWSGEDILFGGEGDDLLAGENDNDKIYGEAGHDILSGGRGDDFLDGGDGRDVLKGDTGNDLLAGGTGEDKLSGNSGEDLLVGGLGQDVVDGGDGRDVLYGDNYFAPIATTDSKDSGSPNATSLLPVPDGLGEGDAAVVPDFWVRLEAEDMRLSNYNQDEQTGASSGSVIATKGKKGSKAKTTFNGPSGTYDLVVGYYDEASGESEISLVIQGQGKGSKTEYTFQLDGSTGAGTYQIAGVTLESGYRIELKGKSDGNDLARLDYLDVLSAGTNPTFDAAGAPTGHFYKVVEGNQGKGNVTRLEAESMELGGSYQLQTDSEASRNAVIASSGRSKGTATLTYAGPSGIYNLYANYFDDSAGRAEAKVLVNGETLSQWRFDQDDNASHERVLGLDITLNQGDVIQIQGDGQGGDEAIIDYLVLEHVSEAESTDFSGAGISRVEAEQMSLQGEKIKIEDKDYASGGSFIRIDKGNDLTATTTFSGETGLYDIVVGYYDLEKGTADYTATLAGKYLGSWQGTLDLGKKPEEAAITHTLSGVLINTGDQFSLQSTQDDKDKGYLDYVEFVAVGADIPSSEDILQIEVEHMNLSGKAKVEEKDFAFDNGYVKSDDDKVGFTGTTLFEGETGYYDVVVGYYDGNKGAAEIAVKVDNKELDRWYADQDLGAKEAGWQTFTTRTVARGVQISQFDLIELVGIKDGEDEANLDYIQFIAVDPPTSSVSASEVEEADDASSDNGDILRGGAGNDTAYGGDGDDLVYGDSGDDILYGDYDTEAVIVSATPETLTFQQGVNGYSGTVDTWLHGFDPNSTFGSDTQLSVDGDWWGQETHILLRFEELFGTQAGQIGLDDTINSAVLELALTNSGRDVAIYEMLQSWSENDSWNSAGNGIQTDGVEAANVPFIVTDLTGGIVSIDVTSSLQAWQADPSSNYGWAFLPTNSGNAMFFSSEGSVAPQLLVDVNQGSESQASTLTQGLVGHWAFDATGGIQAVDSIGGHNGTLVNFATNGSHWVAGQIGNALDFDGDNDRIEVLDTPELDITDQITLAAWVNADSFDDWDGLITKGTSDIPYSLDLRADGRLSFTANYSISGGVGGGEWLSNTVLTTNQWHHIAATYDGNAVRFYIDGQLDSNVVYTDMTFATTSQSLVLGADLTGSYFDGEIDDARVYNRALSDEEITELTQLDASVANEEFLAGEVYFGSRYLLTDSVMTWADAQAYAESLGGNLVTINDAAENQWLKNTFGTTEALWIGFSDAETEGIWKWASGEASLYTDWAPNQPDDHLGNQDYAILSHIWDSSTDKWDDVYFDAQFRGIIEIELPAYADSGHDQLVGGSGNDILNGGAGNDILNGTDAVSVGNFEQDILTGGSGSDRFILGDANQAYYSSQGAQDYVTITDFMADVDVIELHGSIGNYQQQQQGGSTALYLNGQELIAIFENTNGLNLAGNSFEFLG